MLRIVLKNGDVREYKETKYTDYDWNKSAFVVLNNDRWIAIFNWDEVREVLYMENE